MILAAALAAALPAAAPLPSYAPSSAPITLELVAARFKALDESLRTLKAELRQSVRVEGSGSARAVEGAVSFQKPGKLRLVHRRPEPQTVVSDGTWLWVHRPSTNQVIKTRLEHWRRSEPLAQGLLDFGRSADLLSRYDAALSTVSAPSADGHRRFSLRLRPKDGSDEFELTLSASDKDFFPTESVLRAGRAVVRTVFQDVRFNPELPAGEFRFSPPPGADVFQSPAP